MNFRFKYMAAILAALTLLSACAPTSGGTEQTPPPSEAAQSATPEQTPSPVPAVTASTSPSEIPLPGIFSREELAAIVSDVFGRTDFIHAGSQRQMGLDELAQTIAASDDLYAAVRQYALLDLDGDGEDELVLWLAAVYNEYFGFVILHSIGGELYGYSRDYRGLMELKADGTYTVSSGAADWGYCTMSFMEDGSTDTAFTWCQSTGIGSPPEEEYFVEGVPASRGEFDAAVARQSAKEDAPWISPD